jgi:hypothetical protein
MNDSIENHVLEINKLIPNIKAGSLRFFGVWFGKPYDNCHKLVKAESTSDLLLLTFNEGETLEIISPKGLDYSSEQFEIQHAKQVIWNWYYYGREKMSSNLFHYKFMVAGNNVLLSTNATWYAEKQIAQLSEPAVKIY